MRKILNKKLLDKYLVRGAILYENKVQLAINEVVRRTYYTNVYLNPKNLNYRPSGRTKCPLNYQ